MVFAPPRGESGAVPSVEGKLLFVPPTRATVAVAVALLMFAALVAATAGLVPLPLPRFVLVWLCYCLAFGLLARAVGEFKYVGFFKRVRTSRFATLDTWLYSPLCFCLRSAWRWWPCKPVPGKRSADPLGLGTDESGGL